MFSRKKILSLLSHPRNLVKYVPEFINSLLRSVSCSRGIPLEWEVADNWGDKLSPFLVQKLTGRFAYKPLFPGEMRYSVIGSVLDRAYKNSVVWGSGFISADSRPKGHPLEIHAVRGPLTRNLLLQNNIDCPEVYGDPAILLRHLVPGSARKEFLYGIIPHYVDKGNLWVMNQKKNLGVLLQ